MYSFHLSFVFQSKGFWMLKLLQLPHQLLRGLGTKTLSWRFSKITETNQKCTTPVETLVTLLLFKIPTGEKGGWLLKITSWEQKWNSRNVVRKPSMGSRSLPLRMIVGHIWCVTVFILFIYIVEKQKERDRESIHLPVHSFL